MSNMNDTGTIEKIGSQVFPEISTSATEDLPLLTPADPAETQPPDEISGTTVSVVPPTTVQEQPSSEEAFSPIIGYPPMTNQGHASSTQVQAIIDKVQGLPVTV